MGYFGQKNYTEKVGNGPYSIAQIGCFLTAFCNLLESFGQSNVTPPFLDTYFIDHNDYLIDPEDGAGVKDDLAWGSITAYDSAIQVTGVKPAGGPTWPNTNHAIVKFVYDGGMTHFCLVADYLNETIVDSYDGVVKSVKSTPYGQPVSWATYSDNAVQAVVALESQPLPPAAPAHPGGSFTLNVTVPGYTTAANAAAHSNRADTVLPGTYAIFNQADGMVNVTSKAGVPGSWINPADNVVPQAAPAAPAAPANPSPNSYTVNQPIPGYVTSNDAANHIHSNSTVPVGTYAIFNQAHGMVNVTRKAGEPGWWINPSDNGGHGEGTTGVTPNGDKNAPFAMTSYLAGTYQPKFSMDVKDLSNPNAPTIPLHESEKKVYIAGSFITGGVTYLRPSFAVKDNNWYGIPADDMTRVNNLVAKPTGYQRLLMTVGAIASLVKHPNKQGG